MGVSIGFYFRNMTKEEVNQVRDRLNKIAAGLGYFAQAGPTKGKGNAAALLVAIAAGQIELKRKEGE